MGHGFFRRAAALPLMLALLLTLPACGSPRRHDKTYYTFFDTVTTVVGYGSEKEFAAACAIAEDTLETYHRLCDIYHEYSGMNNLCTVNLRAGEAPVAVAPELLDVLSYAREMYDETDGQCNIALGAVLSLWHECRETALAGGEAALPAEDALQEAARHCDIDNLVLDRAAGTVFLADSAMSLDLGAVAKGYAVEQAARAMESAGYTGYALSVGGNVRTLGPKGDGTPWIAGVQNPDTDSESAYVLRLSLADASLVTSGSYQRFYEVDGARYHHIISPDTLYPKNEFLSVSILCADSARADVLSTAVFNMDFSRGYDYVNHLEDVEACWIRADGEIVCTDGFASRLLE